MKRDINLLPAKGGGPKKTTGVAVAIVIAFVYVLVFGLGVLIPQSIKNEAVATDNMLQNQINQLQPQVDEYNRLKKERDFLRMSINSTGSLAFGKFTAADALEIVKATCPTGVMIDRMANDSEGMIIDCVAANNYQIAQFALELERTGFFEDVFIDGSAPADIAVGTNEQIIGIDTVRTTLILIYDLSEPVEEEGGEQ